MPKKKIVEAENVEIKVKTSPLVPIRSDAVSIYKPREDLYKMLEVDGEYRDLEAHVLLPEELEETAEPTIKKETKVSGIQNIMDLLYMDIEGAGTTLMSLNTGLTVEEVKKIQRNGTYTKLRAAALQGVIDKAKDIMDVSAIKAVKTLTECMCSDNERVRLSAATEVLNRIGLTATQHVEVTATTNTMEQLTDDQLNEILRTAVDVDTFTSEEVDNG